MAFSVKDWKDYPPETSTPLSAAAMEDLETRLSAYSDSLFPAWATWSPTWTNLTVGNGTLAAKYIQLGKFVHFKLTIKFGSGTSISGAVEFTLPVTATAAAPTGFYPVLGVGQLEDSGTAIYEGRVSQSATTKAEVSVFNASGTYLITSALSSTVPFTWTTNDEIHMQGVYEAA